MSICKNFDSPLPCQKPSIPHEAAVKQLEGSYSMKVIQSASASQNNPSKPANAVNSPRLLLRRTSAHAVGAFLFVAVIAGVLYASSPTSVETTKTNASARPETSTNAQNESNTKDESMFQDSNNQAPAEKQSNSNESNNVSTSISSVNGKTEVKVNGQTVQPTNDGSVSKTVTTDQGTVNINVNQQSSTDGTSFGSSTTMYNSSSSSSTNGNFNFSSESTMQTGN
jgi:hypothetical protein